MIWDNQDPIWEQQVNRHSYGGAQPVLRVATLTPYLWAFESAGAPVERLLARAGIAVELLGHPAAALPFENVYRFGELACRNLGTEHLGLQMSLARSLDDYGPYGQMLRRSLTVHEYLRRGVSLYNMLTTAQRVWLSEHGNELRFNVATLGGYELGAYQSQCETLVVTLKKLREADPNWSPREISLAYRSREELPEVELFAGSRILRGTGETYFTIPPVMLGRRFPVPATSRARMSEAPLWRSLPETMGDLVLLQIESLMSDRLFQIDTIAETLAMSRRSLQRRLASEGVSYSQVLTDARMRQAADWLENSDKPVAEAAFELGYTDASNFTRAFRKKTGVSPQTYRDSTRSTLRPNSFPKPR
jgi:AraC-like DNA-binding protein